MTIDVDVGSVSVPTQLIYQHLSIADIPALPPSFSATGTIFDLTTSAPLLHSITITARFSSADATLARSDVANVVIQHYKDATWRPLLTDVDFILSTATAQVDTLSLFALTIREPAREPAATPRPPPTPTPTPLPSATPSPSPTAIPTATPNPTPVPTATATPVPVPTPVLVFTPSPLVTAIPVPTPVPAPTLTPTPLPEYLLETAISPEDLGSIETLPESDDGRYPSGTVVVVTAQCDLGFVSWAGDVPQGVSPFYDSVTVTMARDMVMVALCGRPTPTATLAPTATPEPRYKLSINGFDIGPGQGTMAVGNGTIVLSQPTDAEGTYLRDTVLTLQADTGGIVSQVFWSGVYSQSGNVATVRMAGPDESQCRSSHPGSRHGRPPHNRSSFLWTSFFPQRRRYRSLHRHRR